MLAVNVKGPFIGIKHALPLLRKNGGGSIINILHLRLIGIIHHEAYTTTKGALTLLTKSVGALCEGQHPHQFHPSQHG